MTSTVNIPETKSPTSREPLNRKPTGPSPVLLSPLPWVLAADFVSGKIWPISNHPVAVEPIAELPLVYAIAGDGTGNLALAYFNWWLPGGFKTLDYPGALQSRPDPTTNFTDASIGGIVFANSGYIMVDIGGHFYSFDRNFNLQQSPAVPALPGCRGITWDSSQNWLVAIAGGSLQYCDLSQAPLTWTTPSYGGKTLTFSKMLGAGIANPVPVTVTFDPVSGSFFVLYLVGGPGSTSANIAMLGLTPPMSVAAINPEPITATLIASMAPLAVAYFGGKLTVLTAANNSGSCQIHSYSLDAGTSTWTPSILNLYLPFTTISCLSLQVTAVTAYVLPYPGEDPEVLAR